jgi:hypothetical protein
MARSPLSIEERSDTCLKTLLFCYINKPVAIARPYSTQLGNPQQKFQKSSFYSYILMIAIDKYPRPQPLLHRPFSPFSSRLSHKLDKIKSLT